MKEMKKKAKKGMLKELSKDMSEMLGDGYKESMGDKMAVKVMSDSPEGLEEGLDKAKMILQKRAAMMGDEYEEEEKREESEEEGAEYLEKKIGMLKEKLSKMKK